MSNTLIVILASVSIALFLGILIILVHTLLPKEKRKPEKLDSIFKILPKRDCGVCGFAGCEEYARALAEDPELINRYRCPFMLRDEQKKAELEKVLDIKIEKKKKK